MGKYDSPGFDPPVFGMPEAFGNGRDGALTGPGSDGVRVGREAPEARIELGTPIITTPHSSSQVAADNPTTVVDAAQTQVPGQVPLVEPFSGAPNTWRESFPGAGGPSAHVSTPHHPNAASR